MYLEGEVQEIEVSSSSQATMKQGPGLKGSWGLVAKVTIRVTILMITYNPT